MPRNIVIPPVEAPGFPAGSGTMTVTISLVDSFGATAPISDAANTKVISGLGKHTVGAGGLKISLPTQGELSAGTSYVVTTKTGRETWSAANPIQINDGTDDIPWAEFVGLSSPVPSAPPAWYAAIVDRLTAAESRLLPDGVDGDILVMQDGQWVASVLGE